MPMLYTKKRISGRNVKITPVHTYCPGRAEKRIKMEEFKLLYEGKVREVYDIGENLVIAATDRISAFDHILKNKITAKGAILTQMSKFWFDYTKDVVPNHMITVDNNDMPEFFHDERFYKRAMMCKKLTMLPKIGRAHV